MSSQDTKKNLVGQPIFKQLVNFIPKGKFGLLVNKHQSARYYKTFTSWNQLVTMLFGVFSRCDSMRDICDGMMGLKGKLNHLGLGASPAKSTASDGLRGRDNAFFKDVSFMLLEHFGSLLSVSRIDNVSFSK